MTEKYRSGNTLRLAVFAAILAVVMSAPAMAEPEFLALSAAGLYEIDGESNLRLERFQGWIMIRAGGDGQVSFRSTAMDDKNIEVPAEMWKNGRTLMLLPDEGSPPVAVRMEVAIPPGFSLNVLLDDTELTVSNIYGDVTLDLRDGRARLQNITGSMDLESRDSDVRIGRVGGRFSAELQGGRLEAGGLSGPVELDGEDAEVILTGNQDLLRANLSGGSLKAAGVALGGEFRLQGTPLNLKECKGDIRVETDAAIGFTDCKADLHFDAYGASVTGNGNEGILELKTNDAEITLSALKGATRIQGDRLQVDIQEVGGELWVLGSSSSIKIDNSNSPVVVENEFGDVHILAVSQKVDVKNRDGNVTIERQSGPVVVSADGEHVSVTWVSLNWAENSVVENTGGDVMLFLPQQGGCNLDVRSSYGRIETDIEEVVIGDDSKYASGSVNRARKPLLRVRAEGDIQIMNAPILEK